MKRLVLFMVLVGTASILLGAEPSPYEIRRVEGRVKIDGVLDDDAWKHAQPVPGFVEIESGAAPLYPVQAGMLWDSSNLYVGFAVADTNVWAFKTIRDDPMVGKKTVGVISCVSNIPSGKGGWGEYVENFVKVYLDPDSDGRNYIEMHVNPLNKVCDKWQSAPWKEDIRQRMGIEGDAKAHPEWNCPGLVTCTHTHGSLNDTGYGDHGWTVEMAIPFSSIREVCGASVNVPPRTGDVWSVHLGRRYRADPETENVDYWTWPVIGRRDCHTPDKWAKAVFTGVKATDKASESFLNPWSASNGVHSVKGSDLKKPNFKWKGLWVRPLITVEEIERMIDLADGMGFNAIVVAAAHSGGRSYYDSGILAKPKNVKIDPLKEIVERAHARGIEVYAWTCNLMCEPMEYMNEHPELLQVIRPWEEESASLARANPDCVNAHRGNWLCPDRGLNEVEKNVITELMTNYDLDGIGLDYLGYRNYYGCFCEYSRQKRSEYATKHPQLTEKEIMRGFSEESLVNWTREVREHVLSLKKDAKLVIHIYPDFDLEPEYGSKLPVEYCAQTVSWFYDPLWSSIKCKQCCEMYAAADAKEGQFDNFVPFVGIIDAKDRSTSPEQFRQYLRIAGESSDSLMVAFYKTFPDNTNLITVAREELGGTPVATSGGKR